MKSSTETLIAALRILATDIQSNDGVANSAIAEAADRFEEFYLALKHAENFKNGVLAGSYDPTYGRGVEHLWSTIGYNDKTPLI